MDWVPTRNYLHGIIIKEFLPRKKHPDLQDPNLKDLYPGDEVYVIERKGDNWARGYVIRKPLPNEFAVSMLNLENIPQPKAELLVFPIKYVEIFEELPLLLNESKIKPTISGNSYPSYAENEKLNSFSDKSLNTVLKPEVPIAFLGAKKLEVEIMHSLDSLTSYIYALYSIGEFRLFMKLVEFYYKLESARLCFSSGILTSVERKKTIEYTIYLLNKIPKELGSKIARINLQSNENPDDRVDSSGFRAILAHDVVSGEFLSDKHTKFEIAQGQVLSALLPNYPLNYQKKLLESSSKATKYFNNIPPSHILVDFKSVSGSSAYQPPGFSGMTAYLYIRNNNKRLTEAFAVQTSSVDALAEVEKLSAALFCNLPAADIESGRVYLVAALVEEISLNNKDNLNIGQIKTIKKGVAAGVADISRIFSRRGDSLASDEAYEFSIKLFASYVSPNSKHKPSKIPEDEGWGGLIDRVVNGSSHGVAINPRAESLVVSIREFRNNIASSSSVSATPISRIDPIFYDALTENFEKLYIRPGKVTAFNSIKNKSLLSLSISSSGNENVRFAKASNLQGSRTWLYASVASGEFIGEVVKMTGFSSFNETPNGGSILLLLYANGDLVAEGKFTYRVGNKIMEYEKEPVLVDLLSINDGSPVAQVEIYLNYIGKAFMNNDSIHKILQYAKYLKAGEAGLEELSAALKSFLKSETIHLVKYLLEIKVALSEIIDMLPSLTNSFIKEAISNNTFHAVVHLLDSVFGKQDHYSYLIDTFFGCKINSSHISSFLIEKSADILKNAQKSWTFISRSLCRVIALIIKLATISVTPSKVNDFRICLAHLFNATVTFFKIDDHTFVNDQNNLLSAIDYILTIRTFSDESTILEVLSNIVDAIGTRGLGINKDIYSDKPVANSKDHLVQINKLLMIQRLFKSELANNRTCRSELLTKATICSMEVLNGPIDIEAARLACSIMMHVSTILTEKYSNPEYADLNELKETVSLLMPCIGKSLSSYYKFTRANEYFNLKKEFTFLFPNQYPFQRSSIDPIVNEEVVVEVLIELGAVFCSLANIGKRYLGDKGIGQVLRSHPDTVFRKFLADDMNKKDLLSILTAVNILRQGKYFPEHKWLSLYASLVNGCYKSLSLILPVLIESFIPTVDKAESFPRNLWGSFWRSALKIPCLGPFSIEHLLEVPRNACDRITCGARESLASMVHEAWDALSWDATEESYVRFNLRHHGGYQIELVGTDYSILKELILFGLQKSFSCQNVAAEMLWTILASEFILNESIIEVEREALMSLLEIFSQRSYSPSIEQQKSFLRIFKQKIRIDLEDIAYSSIQRFISSLEGFLAVLNELNAVPVGPEFEDDRTHFKLKINSFLRNANKPEIFNAFVHSMYEENIKKENFVQAALSMKLLADSYSWDHHLVLPQCIKPKFPSQSSFERKEHLYKIIAKDFIKGNSLERAADVYNELLDSYHEHTYDLKSFAYVHKKLASLYLMLESSEKLNPSYFKVTFMGSGFPIHARENEMIYEGLPFEHITSMHERLLVIYKGAHIISDDVEAKRLSKNVPSGKYLYVCSIEPVNEISDKVFNTSIGARQYARNKNLKFFTLVKKLPNATSLFDLWTEETTYETSYSFPTLMNRSDIRASNTVKLSPLDNAIRAVMSKINDLVDLESLIHIALKEKAETISLFNDLSRQLSGTVNSPVNGGVGKYREFFTNSNYTAPEFEDNIRLLQDAFKDLAVILGRCLALHNKLIPPSMKGAHAALVELYQKNFENEIIALNIDANEYMHQSVAQYTSMLANDRRVSTVSALKSSSLNGLKLTKTKSITSSTSGFSSYSDPSVSHQSSSSTVNGSNRSITSAVKKRSVLNWRSIVSEK